MNINSTDACTHLTGRIPFVERTYQVTLLSEGVYKSCNKYTCDYAYLTLAAKTQPYDLSFFNTDSSFWVCDNSATGHICKDKSLFIKDLVPSIVKVGSATDISTHTLMGTVTLQLIDDEGVFSSFDLTNVNNLPNSCESIITSATYRIES